MRKILPALAAGALLLASCNPTGPSTGAGGGGGTVKVPDHLTITVQPSLVDIGAAMAPAVKVQVRTASNGLVDSSAVDSITVVVTPGSGSVLGATVGGTTTRPVVAGVATFSALTFAEEGTGFTLTFTATGLIGVTDAVSNPFDVTNNADYVYFSSNRTGSFEVWRMKADGSLQTAVTARTMVSDPTPAKNSQNGLVAFSDGPTGIQSLYTMNGDGSGVRQVQTHSDAGQAAWSPNGNTIVARVAAGSPSFGLFRIDGDGTHRAQLSGAVDNYPSWSQDGQNIAFTRYSTWWTALMSGSSGGGGGAQLVSTDTTDRLITLAGDSLAGYTSDAGFVPFLWATTSIRQTAWSPDGMRIAFVLTAGTESHIAVISNLGGGAVVILHDVALGPTPKAAAHDASPTWSPDGTKIYFQSDQSGTSQIWSMNADGSGRVQLTSTGTNFSPSWWN